MDWSESRSWRQRCLTPTHQSGLLRVLAHIDNHLPLAITSPAVAQRIPGLRKRETLFNLDGILPVVCHLCEPLQQLGVCLALSLHVDAGHPRGSAGLLVHLTGCV